MILIEGYGIIESFKIPKSLAPLAVGSGEGFLFLTYSPTWTDPLGHSTGLMAGIAAPSSTIRMSCP